MDEVLLSELGVAERGRVTGLTARGGMRRRLLDLGLCEGAAVECVGKSPCGDPSAYLICGAVIAIRAADAATVAVRKGAAWD